MNIRLAHVLVDDYVSQVIDIEMILAIPSLLELFSRWYHMIPCQLNLSLL